MSSDRDRVLEAVRTSLAQAGLGGPPPRRPAPPRPSPSAVGDQIQLFAERLATAGGKCHRVAPGEVATFVARILHAAGVRSVALSDSPDIQALADDLSAEGVPILPGKAGRDGLLQCDAGVTSAQLAVADTGTVVLDSAAERHRLRSLLPPMHVVVMSASRMVSNLSAALAKLPRPLSQAVTFVTGPSRTADIELQLVVGVHGPKELHVVLVEE